MNRLLANLINQLYTRRVVVIVPCMRAKCSRLSQRDIKWLRYSVCSLSYSRCCQKENVATGRCLPASSSCYKMLSWGFLLCTRPCEKCRVATGLLKENQRNGSTEIQQIFQNMSDFPPVAQVRGQRLMSSLEVPHHSLTSSCWSHQVIQKEN